MTGSITPGLLVLHGNRLELLRDALLEWLSRNPLGPLEEEVVLVQSNGAAEWLKMALAAQRGICAATRVELPARFLWRLYRRVLGDAAVPAQSAVDKDALTWRLMRLLPGRAGDRGFEPVAAFLRDGDAERRLQLARRLADLYDQYQVYRDDWLDAWTSGRDVIVGPAGAAIPLGNEQRWQALLWRAVLGELDAEALRGIRPRVHRDMLAALESDVALAATLPRRVVLFGASHLPMPMLEALVALSRRAQVLVAVPDPCRFHWADSIDGRELLRAARRRQPLRGPDDPAAIPLDAMHAHAHPLLAAWGRQGRDFMRQLDAADDRAEARGIALPRIDVFDEGPGRTLLGQVQAAIRDLLPLPEHPRHDVAADDRSIVFHVAHGAQREVEILHDQLLDLLAARDGAPALAPRDVVVMVPDIEAFAPAIRAVFGQYPRGDARHIPFDIADLQERDGNPLLLALDWLLRAPAQRFLASEIGDLLDVPAVARRFGLEPESRPRLAQWIAGAGARWGLDATQREQLDLGACGDQNTWRFALRRMLLGYAAGEGGGFDSVVPYGEIGGLDASLVGVLADLIDRLDAWLRAAAEPASPMQWAVRARELVAGLFAPTDPTEQQTLAVLEDALAAWLDACARAGFAEAVPLAVLREGWLGGLDAPGGGRRFLGGGVTFCTLMPLRAIPFEVVCLLGMNDGDYPRPAMRDDFDLMRLPGQYRPGDRSRREDDRYLMLEALLSARRVLYVGWSGRSPRDNSEQPPSVLVAQLRDYLAAGWRGVDGGDLLSQLTTQHPLQPFSRRYFEGGALFTYAREWRDAHRGEASTPLPALPPFDAAVDRVDLRRLERLLRNPVREFFRVRLDVAFDDDAAPFEDDEPFALGGLEAHGLLASLLVDPQQAVDTGIRDAVSRGLETIRGAGLLPMGAVGARAAAELGEAAQDMLARWDALRRHHPDPLPPRPLRFDAGAVAIDDRIDGLYGGADGTIRLGLTASRVLRSGKPAADKLLGPWVRMLAASTGGVAMPGVLIAPDATLRLPSVDATEATGRLHDLLGAWQAAMQAPLPFAARTALAWLQREAGAAQTYEGGRFTFFAERDEPCLARVYPDFAALVADGRFATYAVQLFGPLLAWTQDAVGVAEVGAATDAEHGDD